MGDESKTEHWPERSLEAGMCYLAAWFVFTVDGALNMFICREENSWGETTDTGKGQQTGGPSVRREPRRD